MNDVASKIGPVAKDGPMLGGKPAKKPFYCRFFRVLEGATEPHPDPNPVIVAAAWCDEARDIVRGNEVGTTFQGLKVVDLQFDTIGFAAQSAPVYENPLW